MSTLSVWRNSPVLRLGLTLTCGLALLIALLLTMGGARSPDVALAQGLTIRYVDCVTGSDDGNDCADSSTPCATIQHAVDVADPGDEIRAATATCTDVQARAGKNGVDYKGLHDFVSPLVYHDSSRRCVSIVAPSTDQPQSLEYRLDCQTL